MNEQREIMFWKNLNIKLESFKENSEKEADKMENS